MDVDVAIIGGGPAGCGAALALSGKGHSVAVISSPIAPHKPTETASPALKHLLGSIGGAAALSACEPCFGISSNWGRTIPVLQSSLLSPFGYAWFIHRPRFDLHLKRASQSMGVVWIAEKARNANFDGTGVSIETTGAEHVRSKWLILATGSPSWPARITRQTPSMIDPLVAYWARLPVRLEERLLFVEATEHGWWYLCPGDDNGTIACFVTDPASARSLRISKLDNWNKLFHGTVLSRQFGVKEIAPEICVASTGVAALPRSVGSRWIAVGDAAAKLDPIGSAGVPSALDFGRRAALAVSGALLGDITAINQYARSIQGLIEEFVRQRDHQYAIEASRQTSAFWTARSLHVA
jgi:flavin-dependent dehydrogenase